MKPATPALLQLLAPLDLDQTVVSRSPETPNRPLTSNHCSDELAPTAHTWTRLNHPIRVNQLMLLSNLPKIQHLKIPCCKNDRALLNKQHRIIVIRDAFSLNLVVNTVSPQTLPLCFEFFCDLFAGECFQY